jgi:uncharacterized protein (TIGR04255 family)
MGIPLNKKHAIESASFILAYEKQFPQTLIASLAALQDLLKIDLPIFQLLNIIELKFDAANPTTSSLGKESGVFLQSTNAEGKQTWGLKVEANQVIVSAFQYDNWNSVSNHAFKLMKTVSNLLVDQENPIITVGFQVIDKFISPPSNEYDISDVFNSKSEFLTKHAANSGRLWHVFQGWFDTPVSNSGRLLNVLNLATNDTVDGVVTTIDHNIQIQGRISSTEAVSEEWLRKSFNELHTANKTVMSKLLNSRQKKAIKL